MGVESQAILERWIAEPETRPFADWNQLIVVTAQVGEEHKNDTIPLMEERTLPELRRLGVRFVELARKGHLEEEGIVILQDTRAPVKLHPDGVYKLSDELLMSGTVPQFGGEHRCAMKFKAFVIETWLAWEFRGETHPPVYHVFGYNADETSRATNSEFHIARHNEDRQIPQEGRPPIEVFGFNAEEIGRVDRSRKYDGPTRTGCYPLPEWGWNRLKCLAYIFEKTGLHWKKSHCSFCPFCAEATKGQEGAVQRWWAAPEQTAHGLVVEYNSMCFNHRGHLYRDRALIDVVTAHKVTPVLEAFERELDSMPWALYEVRRIYTKRGKAMRCVERSTTTFDRQRAVDLLELKWQVNSHKWKLRQERGINYLMFAERVPDTYPAVEGFHVAAPAFMQTKLRGPIDRFNERWERVVAGKPLHLEAA